MSGGIQFKVCGVRRPEDAAAAAEAGAAYLGFNFFPGSPRALTLTQYQEIEHELPAVARVAVTVEPTLAELDAFAGAGFQTVQIHFRTDLPLAQISAWSEQVGPARVWLAPKLPPGDDIPPAWLPLADTWMLDTYQPGVFGGSGRTGDWGKFARHHRAHPEKSWLLAGGLNADNIGEAVRQSGARLVDVNSGIELAPGVKDHGKLRAFAANLSVTGGSISR
jgi:phosphoribosylanthranilate isomerase